MARIYVANLGDYNAGRLIGRWIDVDGLDAEDIAEEIATMMVEEDAEGEEYAIHDYDDFGPFKVEEYDSLERVAALAKALLDVVDVDALAAFMDNRGSRDFDDELMNDFNDAYLGEWESAADWAEAFAESCGIAPKAVGGMASYVRFDAKAYAHDCVCGGDIWTAPASGGRVYVFSGNN